MKEVDAEEKAVERHFSKEYVYYAGSHGGCSCGLLCSPEDSAEDRDSAKALLSCIDRILQSEPTVELYACWVDNQAKVPQEWLQTDFADIDVDTNGFDLKENMFLTIKRRE
ncbi:hypothetical protein [Hymenobacter oligotrophus]|uniref:hypothetical protein n=1 Tax=Hymenobacter oligotrophus TaxID=2319843 RepID=UPI0013C329F2|nr:hypothetical protein [Hymenobacter oligotrophus]